jgi:hypothetical protein
MKIDENDKNDKVLKKSHENLMGGIYIEVGGITTNRSRTAEKT